MVTKAEKKKEDKLSNLPILPPLPESEKEEKYLREVCDYEFINLKEPGVMHAFNYGDVKNNHKFQIFHGQNYRFPRFIARHIESCATPLWDWKPDGSGKMIKNFKGNDTRFQMREKMAGYQD